MKVFRKAFTLAEVPEARQYGSKHKLSSVAKELPEARHLKSRIATLTTFARNDRKRVAFTLAEVLITLGIIGVVAAMTIPTLMNAYDKKATVTKLKKAYSSVSQAIKFAQADGLEVSSWTPDYTGCQASVDFSKNFIEPYVKTVRKCDCVNSSDCTFVPNYLNGNEAVHITSRESLYQKLFLSDGIEILLFFNPDSNYLSVIIDVNGQQKPNVVGKDVFEFEFIRLSGLDGLYPRFTSEIKDGRLLTDNPSMCNKNREGSACAAVIYMNGWKMPDNYPW